MSAHRDLCHVATLWLMNKPKVDIACWEVDRGYGIIDAMALSLRKREIYIVEAKVSRADLLQDLKKKKLLKYETASSHCYLIGTMEVFVNTKSDSDNIIADLTVKGLPTHWGILLYDEGKVKVLRRAQRHRSQAMQEKSLHKALKDMGRIHMYRHMNLLNLLNQR